MRLSLSEKENITRIIYAFDAQAKIYLYGSRVDDKALGGDIDLLLLSNTLSFLNKLNILSQLHCCLGDRKIDITICRDLQQDLFAQLALESGILL